MIRNIMKDEMFLQGNSKEAAIEDIPIAQDLLDTLIAHQDECVGMAANMIGEHKRIIAFWDEQKNCYQVMLNPEIIKNDGKRYECEEGCLSLQGVRKAKRYHKIKVRYQDTSMKEKIKTYEGFSAQIIQHEVDHCNGILI